MSFTKLLKDTVTISRLTVGVGVQKTYVAYATSVKAFVQPLGAEQSALHGHAMGKAYKMYIDVIGIEAGDKVIFGNQDYRVQGVEDFNFTVTTRKYQLAIMTKEDS